VTANCSLYSWWWVLQVAETCKDLEKNQVNTVASSWISLYIFRIRCTEPCTYKDNILNSVSSFRIRRFLSREVCGRHTCYFMFSEQIYRQPITKSYKSFSYGVGTLNECMTCYCAHVYAVSYVHLSNIRVINLILIRL
jgi:hypothetical protein